ncbi:MAG TPA: hypothetical protein VG244_06755 [Acidimicrobiales bacterium]|nr:hypothetical protein [Acidimicrobiales bacterium]
MPSRSSRDKSPDPLGKRALFWVPSSGEAGGRGAPGGSTVALPVGKRALFSGARPERDSLAATSANPLVERGSFTVECAQCHQTAHVGALDLLIFQFPIGVWLPRGRFDHRMTCPTCRKRAWCSVTLRRA